MARIPQYNRSVTPQNTPYEYIKSPSKPEAFGLGVSSAMGNLGDAALGALDVAASLKQQYDKTKLLEFGNTIDAWVNNTLYDKDNGYFYKTGKEAMGKSPELMESYDKYVDELLGSSGFVGGYANAARKIAASKRITTENNIERHDRQETDKWQDTVYSDSFSNIFNKALQNRNDPDALQMYYRDAMTVLDNYALIKGWNNDPEMMEIKRKEFGGNFHATILDAYLAEGSLKALDYFEEHKESFDPETQNKYLQKIHSEEINYKARSAAQMLMDSSPEEATKYINGIENIEERDAIEREYNRLLRQKDQIKSQIEKDALEKFYTTAYEKMQRGENLSYDDIPDSADAETKLNLMRYINSNGNPSTDDETWEMLYEKSVNDAQGFAQLDLNRYRGSLSDSEYRSFLKRQQDISTGNYYTQIKDDDENIQAALDSIGLKNKSKDVAISEIRHMVKELEARRGRKISDVELDDIINSLGYEGKIGKEKYKMYKQLELGMAKRAGFIRDVINDFTYYQAKHNGQLPSNEEKLKIINNRIGTEISKQNNEAREALTNPYIPKEGDVWNGHIITSVYGKRKAPTKGATTDHKGVDLAYRNNEIFVAFASGTVSNVGYDADLGNFVDIKSNDGTIHRYGHANTIIVKRGEKIKAGQGIGKAGATGTATGVHVHYAKLKNGNFINPLDNTAEKIAKSNKNTNDKNEGWVF